MKRSILKKYLIEIAKELEEKPYEYWLNIEFPLSFERKYESHIVYVEINLLSSTSEYIQIGVSVDDGGLSAYFPVGYSTIIEKKNNLQLRQ